MGDVDRMLQAARRFRPVGDAHELELKFGTQPVSAPSEDGVTIRITIPDGHLVIVETLPDDQVAGWIDAFTDGFEMPNVIDLDPDEWRATRPR